MNKNSLSRHSNFELFRLILIAFVIILHYNGYICNLLQLTETSSFLIKYTTRFGESLSICAVNCFIILSGFFLERKNSVSIKNVLYIFLPVVFYSFFI